ncbi:hypothetical protein NHQ30_003349 [Ciborinia camelliae]|nr:hypothetical protein NHQ30_003349 [Ciborinia camelliae]
MNPRVMAVMDPNEQNPHHDFDHSFEKAWYPQHQEAKTPNTSRTGIADPELKMDSIIMAVVEPNEQNPLHDFDHSFEKPWYPQHQPASPPPTRQMTNRQNVTPPIDLEPSRRSPGSQQLPKKRPADPHNHVSVSKSEIKDDDEKDAGCKCLMM